jgi:hypothetical protein
LGCRRDRPNSDNTIITVADPQLRGMSLDIAAGFQRLAQQGALLLGNKNSNERYQVGIPLLDLGGEPVVINSI